MSPHYLVKLKRHILHCCNLFLTFWPPIHMSWSLDSTLVRPSTQLANHPFSVRWHSLIFQTQCTTGWWTFSAFQSITASIIQGSAIGPVSFVVNASDLSTLNLGNSMHKYADDTYITIKPACNIVSREAELDHVSDWAQMNNLKLKRAKSVEIVVTDSRRRPHSSPFHLSYRGYLPSYIDKGAWSNLNQSSVCLRSCP